MPLGPAQHASFAIAVPDAGVYIRFVSAARGDSHLADRLPILTVRERTGASKSRTRVTEASSLSANASVSTGGHIVVKRSPMSATAELLLYYVYRCGHRGY